MDLYRKVRLACAEGMSQREAARHFGVSRDSVRKMLSFSVPPGYRRRAEIRRPKLDGFTEIVERPSGLRADKGRPRKPRHTAKRVFDRLREGEPCRAIGPSDNGERVTGGTTSNAALNGLKDRSERLKPMRASLTMLGVRFETKMSAAR